MLTLIRIVCTLMTINSIAPLYHDFMFIGTAKLKSCLLPTNATIIDGWITVLFL